MSIEEKQNSPTYLDSENIEYPQNEREVSNYIKKNYKSNTPIELIEERGYRDLYKKYDNGLIENVVGKDIKFDQPYNSDYVINNIKSKKIFIEEGAKIVNSLLVKLK